MSITVRRAALAPIVAAALAAMATASVHAQSVVYNNLLAKGLYSFNNGATTALSSGGLGATNADVLRFTGDGTNSVGLHSYGSTSGNFGSRSSGSGIYDVTGSFNINLTLTNDQSTAQHIKFNFYITPGYLNTTALPYTSGQFTEADLGFQINASNGASFSSTAKLASDDSGNHFSTTGESSLYTGSGSSYQVKGGNYALDLGVLNAGESVTVDYTLSSHASGNAINGTTTFIPGYDVTIPEHWVEYTDCGYGNGYATQVSLLETLAAQEEAVAVSPYGGECVTKQQKIEKYVYHVADQTVLEGEVGGSQASSGDPFGFANGPGSREPQTNTNPALILPSDQFSPISFTSTAVDVPEPAGLGMAALALGALAFSRRRQR